MPDVYVVRHLDRWAVKESPDATPYFEAHTREEAEAEARRAADGGTVHWDEEQDPARAEDVGQQRKVEPPEPADVRPHADRSARGEGLRGPQGGL
ncbi:MAG TPA: DUF2188 domain-containing protein [Solirubrobacteraceae bacterium]|nr:DUF2188 domain-containing protein [Solirubrobacteraceae bacterium]